MTGLILLIIGTLAAGLWWRLVKSRELAREAAGLVCAGHGLLLMDDTVVLDHVSWQAARQSGHFHLVYRFEFARDGVRHRGGNVLIRHPRHARVVIKTRDGQVIEDFVPALGGGTI
jgi:hypothetical protein